MAWGRLGGKCDGGESEAKCDSRGFAVERLVGPAKQNTGDSAGDGGPNQCSGCGAEWGSSRVRESKAHVFERPGAP